LQALLVPVTREEVLPMLRTSWGRWLVAACLLVSATARGQSVEHRDSDTLEPPAKAAASGRTPDLARVVTQILDGTNQFRRLNERRELKVNAELTRAARSFADYLARTDKFSHTADGRQPSERAAANGYEYCIVAENIALEYDPAGFTSRSLARGFLTGWKNSPGHRRNLLDPDVTETGVAVARSEKAGRYYAVQEFGRPRSAALVFQVTNEADAVARYTVDGKSFTLPPATTRTHERCRPADLDFEGAGDSQAPEESRVFHPTTGKHYVIRGDAAGGYRMAE
jgi:uncharacterized protein YkwD